MRRRDKEVKSPMLRVMLCCVLALIVSIPETPVHAATESDSAQAQVTLPQPLSDADAERLTQIFALQEDGKWRQADALIAELDSDLVSGHVLSQRYLHPTSYRSSYKELKLWLDSYADHPRAETIYRLAVKRRPKGWKAPKRAVGGTLTGGGHDFSAAPLYRHRSTKRLSSADRAKARQWRRLIVRRIKGGWPTGALELLEGPTAQRVFDQIERDRLLARIATGYYHFGKPDLALKYAAEAARRSSQYVPEAHWTAGLTAWRQEKFDRARIHFAALSDLKAASAWDKAAGAYWSARIDLRTGRFDQVVPWLEQAAQHPQTFYGLMAVRALGLERSFDWDNLELTKTRQDLISVDPAGRRALALLQAGQRDYAEQELRKLAARADGELLRATLALADRVGMTDLTMRLGSRIASQKGEILVNALYPMPAWRPQNGFTIDRALIYAFIRQESRFNTRARSYAGARGLMQLMPATARYIAGERLDRARLYEPELNLSLGQKYVGYLLDQPVIEGNLFHLLAAYNGGIGNLTRWQKNMPWAMDDPLLFIESIPNRETRLFVEKVMSNLWLYRFRMEQELPSLDAVAAGIWPSYVAQDQGQRLADAR